MRFIIGILGILLLAGCATQPRAFEARMSAVADQYRTIRPEMSKQEIWALLGPAQREEDGVLIWELRYDAHNYEALTVFFDSTEQATKVSHENGRMTRGWVGSAKGSDHNASERGQNKASEATE